MSRYTTVVVERATAEAVAQALADLGIKIQSNPQGRAIMLDDTFECAGEPVDLRVDAGPMGTIEDFGFRTQGNRLELVCGELDQKIIERDLLPRLRTRLADQRLRAQGLSTRIDDRSGRLIIEESS